MWKKTEKKEKLEGLNKRSDLLPLIYYMSGNQSVSQFPIYNISYSLYFLYLDDKPLKARMRVHGTILDKVSLGNSSAEMT